MSSSSSSSRSRSSSSSDRKSRRSSSKRRLYVTGYSSKEDPHDIKKNFKKYGKIEEFSWKGKFCFIQYEEQEQAVKAVKKMNKEDFNDHPLVVEVARSQRKGGDGVCYTCGKKGHFARNCRYNSHKRSTSGSRDRDRKKKNKKKRSRRRSSSSSKSSISSSSSHYRRKKKHSSRRKENKSRSRSSTNTRNKVDEEHDKTNGRNGDKDVKDK